MELIHVIVHVLWVKIFRVFMQRWIASLATPRSVFYPLKKQKAKYNILVVRINHLEELVDSKPCIMCVHAMKENGINKVYYSTDNGDIECMKVNEMEPEHVSYGTILSMKKMTKRNQYLIFGFTLEISNIDRKNKCILKNS